MVNVQQIDTAADDLEIKEAESLACLRSSIDSSIGSLVRKLFLSAVFWLFVSGVLTLLAGLKLQFPSFLDFEFLSYGRLVPAINSVFAFGWCSTAAIGALCWVLARLNGSVPLFPTAALVGMVLWNAGVLLGLIANLAGVIRPMQGFGFPLAVNILLSMALVVLFFWAVLDAGSAAIESVAGKFLVASVLWFGWSFSVGHTLVATGVVGGVLAHLAEVWIGAGVTWSWLVPVSLGLVCYFVPKVTGVALPTANKLHILFWAYTGFAGLSGISGVPGSVPMWLLSLSASAAILLIPPVLAVVHNIFGSVRDSKLKNTSPTLRFMIFGSALLFLGCLLHSFGVLRPVAYFTRMTLFDSGVERIVLGGGVSLILFGSIYFIMPRLCGGEWLSSTLISLHFLLFVYGVCLSGFMLVLSGLTSGAVMMDTDSLFSQVIETGSTFYWGCTIGNFIALLGCVVFALHFMLLLLRIGQPPGEPTMLRVDSHH